MSNFGAVEPVLADLGDDIKILTHMAHTADLPTEAEWSRMADHLDLSHQTLADQWELAHKERVAERAGVEALKAAHAAELETLKAEMAAPGSVADMKSADACWWLLAGAARLALDRCKEAGRDPRANRPLSQIRMKPKPQPKRRRKRA